MEFKESWLIYQDIGRPKRKGEKPKPAPATQARLPHIPQVIAVNHEGGANPGDMSSLARSSAEELLKKIDASLWIEEVDRIRGGVYMASLSGVGDPKLSKRINDYMQSVSFYYTPILSISLKEGKLVIVTDERKFNNEGLILHFFHPDKGRSKRLQIRGVLFR